MTFTKDGAYKGWLLQKNTKAQKIKYQGRRCCDALSFFILMVSALIFVSGRQTNWKLTFFNRGIKKCFPVQFTTHDCTSGYIRKNMCSIP